MVLPTRRAKLVATVGNANRAMEGTMAVASSSAALGWKAVEFELEATDGRRYRLADLRGSKGTLVMFICNHCPYVKAVLDDIIADVRELKPLGIGAVAIMPNDTAAYPDDSFENMRRLAITKDFPFPYLIDSTQMVARAYGAACTPDFFGFDARLELRYRGRIYDARNLRRVPGSRRELFDAMAQIAGSGVGPSEQYPSMGCSIKWRAEAH
jgi:peroxiredoxin